MKWKVNAEETLHKLEILKLELISNVKQTIR